MFYCQSRTCVAKEQLKFSYMAMDHQYWTGGTMQAHSQQFFSGWQGFFWERQIRGAAVYVTMHIMK